MQENKPKQQTNMKLSSLIGEIQSVDNMVGRNGYSKVPNQFILKGSKGTAFQSYNTLIAVVSYDNNIYLTKDYNYSTTTSKYCNAFLGMSSKDRDAAIKSGEIKIVELSK